MRKSTPKSNDVTSFFQDNNLCSNVVQNKQGIPRKFIEENGNKFRDSVLLKVPSGAVWTVELKIKNGEVWLCKGWKKFTDYFSIGPGHLLVFKYKGNSSFNVIIFDKSALEIDYRFDPDHIGNINKKINSESYVKVETEEDDYFQVRKEIRMNDNPKQTRGIKKERLESISMMANESKALQRAKDFKSQKPLFVVCMTKSYVSDSARATMTAPAAFARKHLSKGHTEIILQVSSRRTWITTCVFQIQPSNCRFYWPSFASDNDMKVGDVCVFKMINHVKVLFHVHIFRAT